MRLANVFQNSAQQPTVTGVIPFTQSEFDCLKQDCCIETHLAKRATYQQLQQLVEMPSVAHVAFYIELLNFVDESYKL